jgi:hypothetical protein
MRQKRGALRRNSTTYRMPAPLRDAMGEGARCFPVDYPAVGPCECRGVEARVEDQIREGLGQGTLGKLRQGFIQRWLIALIDAAEKLGRTASVIAFTSRVETPRTYISASAATSARCER